MFNGYRNGAFALGLVTGVGLALNLFLWLDYQAKQEIGAGTKPNQNQNYTEVGSYWDGLIRTFVSPSDTLAQWIMAAFTIAATVVLIFTLRSANRTNRAAVKASEAALKANDIMRYESRPWVVCKSSFGKGNDQNKEFLHLENKGRIPAVITVVKVSSGMSRTGLGPLRHNSRPDGDAIILPGERGWGTKVEIESHERIRVEIEYTDVSKSIFGRTVQIFWIATDNTLVDVGIFEAT